MSKIPKIYAKKNFFFAPLKKIVIILNAPAPSLLYISMIMPLAENICIKMTIQNSLDMLVEIFTGLCNFE